MNTTANLLKAKEQIEFYLSDRNLLMDEFFHRTIIASGNESIPLDILLKCNAIRKMGVKREDLLACVRDSQSVEPTSDGQGIKRKGPWVLPSLAPSAKRKIIY